MFGAIGNFLGAIGNAVASVLSTVGDIVETVVDAVVDTVEDAVDTVVDTAQNGVQAGQEWLCANAGNIACGVGNVVGGLINGALEGIQDLAHDYLNLQRDLVGFLTSLFRLDLAGALKHLVEFGINFVRILVNAFRLCLGGYFVGGIVGSFQRNSLRDFVSNLISEKFASDADRVSRIRAAIGLSDGTFGFRLAAEHRVFRLDSINVPLWDWHNRGVIDLFAMADLLSFNSFRVQRPRTAVVRVIGDKDMRFVNRTFLSNHIASQGRNGRIRVYAMSREAIAEKLRVATSKCEQLGVRLSWNDGENFSWFRHYSVHDITTEEEYRFELFAKSSPPAPGLDEYILQKDLKSGQGDQDCTLLALGAFHYAREKDASKPEDPGKEQFGLTAGRSISEGSNATGCVTPGRTDQCCSLIRFVSTGRNERRRTGSGVIHRDVWPNVIFRYVLSHEIGHYLGLCHITHDGVQDIMFSAEFNSAFSWNLFNYYLDSEPRFTIRDAMNAWRFIVDQLETCLPGATPPPPSEAPPIG